MRKLTCAVVFFLCMYLESCTQNPAGTTDDPNPSIDTTAVMNLCSQTLESVSTQLENIYSRETPPQPDEVAAVLEQMDSVRVIGKSDSLHMVVGEIGEGGPLCVVYTRIFPDMEDTTDTLIADPAGSSLHKRSNLPSGPKVLMLAGLNSKAYPDWTPQVRRLITNSKRGWTNVTTLPATVENLRNVKNVDVFMLYTHGCPLSYTIPKEQSQYELPTYTLTSTQVPDSLAMITYARELLTRRLMYAYVPVDKYTWVKKFINASEAKWGWLLAITDKFVEENWSFNQNSLAYICACYSASADAFDMSQQIYKSGATVYGGWTSAIDLDFARKKTLFVFDRLLGANLVKPLLTPKQRPFSIVAVHEWLSEGDNGTWPGDWKFTSPSTLEFDAKGDGFRILAPSIATMIVDEANQTLRLYGVFGKEEGTVTIGGQQTTIKNWDNGSIDCLLTKTAAGPVVVDVNGHRSNEVPLTLWVLNMKYTIKGPGSLLQQADMTFELRGDVHSFRREIEDAAGDMADSCIIVASRNSHGTYKGSGTYTSENTTVTYSGTGSLSSMLQSSGRRIMLGGFLYRNNPGQIKFYSLFQAVPGIHARVRGEDGEYEYDQPFMFVPGIMDEEDVFGIDEDPFTMKYGELWGCFALAQKLSVGTDFVISGGSLGPVVFDDTHGEVQAELSWEEAVPFYPPTDELEQ